MRQTVSRLLPSIAVSARFLGAPFLNSGATFKPMLFLIALVATVLALVQNLAMFSLGMKEMAIMSFPLSFAGVFLLQIASI